MNEDQVLPIRYVFGHARNKVFRYSMHRYFCMLSVSVLWLLQSVFVLGQSKLSNVRQTNNRSAITRFFENQEKIRDIHQITLSPDGYFIAWSADDSLGESKIYCAPVNQPSDIIRISSVSGMVPGNETDPQWSPNGQQIAFVSKSATGGEVQLFKANVTSSALSIEKPLAKFDGYVSALRWSPNGKYLSVLYVEKATREPSPSASQNKAVGLIDSLINRDIQRIAIINSLTGDAKQLTPPGLYIYEYDWSPDSKKFVYTAATPPGDDNWFIAKLYQQTVFEKDISVIYNPLRQIAVPRWSPDGRHIAFIEGLMSDQGAIGGEIFMINLDGNSIPENLTPNRASTPAWFKWVPDGNIIFTEFVEGSIAINQLNTTSKSTQLLLSADESIHASNERMSLSVAGKKSSLVFALIRTSWNLYSEVWAGSLKNLTKVTNLNSKIQFPKQIAENIRWVNDGHRVQGWLLTPLNYDSSRHYPMLVCVHGGPAWIITPKNAMVFNSTVYTQLGYFVFFPNPRGSYGQGETFTLANRRDFGFGDLSDILSGVDTVVANYPIERKRIGIFGWSYGGFMSMFAVTQTNRFSAAVSGGGIADWLSYYGQNSIDKWMESYFGVSPYEDTTPYARCSPMTYIQNVKSPTLILVGENDGETPSPQSFQFWHALKELNVTTQLMVYPGEGHDINKLKNLIDISLRTVNWFETYMKTD